MHYSTIHEHRDHGKMFLPGTGTTTHIYLLPDTNMSSILAENHQKRYKPTTTSRTTTNDNTQQAISIDQNHLRRQRLQRATPLPIQLQQEKLFTPSNLTSTRIAGNQRQ
jgi:hypothetical protein